MDTVSEKISTLLSDPESMKNLAELAAMLREAEPEGGGAEPCAAEPKTAEPESGALPFDLGKLTAAAQALSAAQADENAALILALKPHLSAERAARAEKAAKLLRLWNAAEMLKESGVLADVL